jgi:hypothetical protein
MVRIHSSLPSNQSVTHLTESQSCHNCHTRNANFAESAFAMLQTKRKSCPIHHRFDCCGRTPKKSLEKKKGWTKVGPGLYRIEDPTHPRGYRERRSDSAMRDLVDRKIVEQEQCCPSEEMGGCGKPFEDRRDVVPDHIDPRGAGGAFRDDHPSNIQAMHSECNRRKGSRRVR